MLPIFVISVERASERRRHAALQMQRLNIEFEFFSGIDGAAGCDSFESIDASRFLLNTGKRCRDGEIGCYASHKALWQRCLAVDQPIVIMEDDFQLKPRFPQALRTVDALIRDVGYIRLQQERRARSTPVIMCGEFQLERYTKLPHSAMCYAITPPIARRLLSLSRTFVAPVDIVMKRVWEIGQPMYCLTPYTVFDSPLCRHSTIGTRRRCRKPISVRARRTLLKICWRLRQLHFNLKQSDRPLLRLGRRAASTGPTAADDRGLSIGDLHDAEHAGGGRRL